MALNVHGDIDPTRVLELEEFVRTQSITEHVC